MNLKWLTISLLLLEFAITEPTLVRNHEQFEAPVVILTGVLALAAALAVGISQYRRPIPASRFLRHLFVFGLLNAAYGTAIRLDARHRIEFERAQRQQAIHAWEEGRRSPFYRRDNYEWVWQRLDDCAREISIQDERIERSTQILIAGAVLALVAAGGLVAAKRRPRIENEQNAAMLHSIGERNLNLDGQS